MDRFGTRAVRMAWYDPKKADKHVLDGYTKVQLHTCFLEIVLCFCLLSSISQVLKFTNTIFVPEANTQNRPSLWRMAFC